jgi:hypothetical protein
MRRIAKMAENQPEKEVLPNLGLVGTNPEGRDAAEAVFNKNLPGADTDVQYELTEMPEPRRGNIPVKNPLQGPESLFNTSIHAGKMDQASIDRLPAADRAIWNDRKAASIEISASSAPSPATKRGSSPSRRLPRTSRRMPRVPPSRTRSSPSRVRSVSSPRRRKPTSRKRRSPKRRRSRLAALRSAPITRLKP